MERRELAAPAVRTAVAEALRVRRKACHHSNFTAISIAAVKSQSDKPLIIIPASRPRRPGDPSFAVSSQRVGYRAKLDCTTFRPADSCLPSPNSLQNHRFTLVSSLAKSKNRISLRNCGLIHAARTRRHESNAKSGPRIFPRSFTRSHDALRRSHRLPRKRRRLGLPHRCRSRPRRRQHGARRQHPAGPSSRPNPGRSLPLPAAAPTDSPASSTTPARPIHRTCSPSTQSGPVLPGCSSLRPARSGRRSPTGRVRRPAPAPTPRLRAAHSPRPQLHLDSRLLVLGPCRLLLDPRRMVRPALLWSPLDSRLLGLVSQPLGMAPRLLGPPHRLLRRHQLRLRLHRLRLLRRLLERKQLLLQPRRQPGERQHHSRLQPHRRRQQQHSRRL